MTFICVGRGAGMCVEIGGQLAGFGLLHPIGPRAQTQVMPSGKCTYPLNHLTRPSRVFFEICEFLILKIFLKYEKNAS